MYTNRITKSFEVEKDFNISTTVMYRKTNDMDDFLGRRIALTVTGKATAYVDVVDVVIINDEFCRRYPKSGNAMRAEGIRYAYLLANGKRTGKLEEVF